MIARRHPRTWVTWALVATTVAGAPLAAHITSNPAYIYQVATFVAVWAVAATSFAFLAGGGGQLSLAQAAFMAIGSYVTALLVAGGTPFLGAATTAVVSAGLVGAVLCLPALRLRGPYFAMASIGLAAAVHGVLLNWHSVTGGPSGIAVRAPVLGGRPLNSPVATYLVVTGVAVTVIWLLAVVRRSHWGLRIQAMNDDLGAAESCGVRAGPNLAIKLVVGGAAGGVGGVLVVIAAGYVSPQHFTVQQSILVALMGLLGGVGSTFGPVVGASVVSLLAEALREFGEFLLLAQGVGILLVSTVAPRGVVGRRSLSL